MKRCTVENLTFTR